MKNYLRSTIVIMTILMAFSFISCKQETKDKIKDAGNAVVEETKEGSEKVVDGVKDAAEEVAAEVSEMTKRIKFDSGESSTRIKGKITGEEYIDYLVNVDKGQNMNISMATDNSANYFNIMEPGEEYVAIFNGSTAENQFEGTSAKSGDYTIRVYMMRSAGRRGEVANYTLEIIVD
ncbi:YtxH domain-containing protein [Tamlana haliotis]|uniref:YtxH domain-containing protein n=1 Tax=Pseudotamlana haliotis TaxID=2614804 RepID=A0A6N6MCJ8_9FLAO|nr:YtxH domain-containing protein [Tamlana haliotis]KAB1067418.1 YtxH domain-containing protein [Tamlana haliotis]